MSQLALQQQLAWQLLSAPPRLSQPAAVREGKQAEAAAAVSGPSGSGGSRGGAVAAAAAGTQRGRNVAAGGTQAASSSSRLAAEAETSSWGKPAITLTSSSHQHTDATAAGAPWAEKYAPRSLEDLDPAVQSKKVLEVQDWLEDQLPGRFRRGGNCRLMIVTGE